jgi:hypothetical protein
VARSALRGFIDQIVIPPGDALLEVRGDLGRMLTAAAGEGDGSMLAAGGEWNREQLRRIIRWRDLRHKGS